MNKTFIHFYLFLSISILTSAHLVLDLSHDLNNKTLRWPASTQFTMMPAFQGYSNPELPENDEKNYWLEVNDIAGAEHSGTHLDAPVHFAKGQWTVDQIPPDRFFSPVSIVDLRDKVKDNADYQITENDLIEWEKVNKKKLNPLIILWTGWASRWPDRLRYFGTESEDDELLNRFPGLNRGAAEWIVKHGGIHGIGIDSASLDYGQASTNPHVHKILLGNRIFLIENLNTKDLESFPIVNPFLMVAPLKITAGSGSPVRAILFSQLPKDSFNSSTKGSVKSNYLISILVFIGLIFY